VRAAIRADSLPSCHRQTFGGTDRYMMLDQEICLGPGKNFCPNISGKWADRETPMPALRKSTSSNQLVTLPPTPYIFSEDQVLRSPRPCEPRLLLYGSITLLWFHVFEFRRPLLGLLRNALSGFGNGGHRIE
jgi:hypothetical protein